MKLVLDNGNTCVKAGIFEGKKLVEIIHATELTIEFAENIITKYQRISNVILSTVREVNPDVINHLGKKLHLLEFSNETPIPVTNLYKTPITLGIDRLAGVIAANSIYPNENALVIDAGTCITIDMITSEGIYYGGSISPGLTMKFNALHAFTGKLPLVTLTDFNEILGVDTEKSILSGVINGTVAEIDTFIEKYKNLYHPLKVLICGGDARFLADRLKSSIFAVPELVLIGLNEILDHNEL